MKEYKAEGITIVGETLEAAIENDFGKIVKALKIGNVAGYQLHSVWFAYDEAENGVILHITACGSDVLVSYDPAKDEIKEYTIKIGATKEDCPTRVDVNLVEEKPFDPFDDSYLSDAGMCYGIMLAFIDEIAQNRCVMHTREREEITSIVSTKYPTLRMGRPLKYAEECRKMMASLRPKTDKETARMMERISELFSVVIEHSMERPQDKFLHASISAAKTRHYFRTNNKITALAAIRMEKGLTQKQLAEAAQMSVRQLQNYENARSSTLFSASKYVQKRLADALGVKVSDIIEYGTARLVDKRGNDET